MFCTIVETRENTERELHIKFEILSFIPYYQLQGKVMFSLGIKVKMRKL